MVYSSNEEDKCVAITWALLDFELITDNISYVKIPAKTTKYDYARFKQKVWDIDGITIALPPSGYVAKIDVKDLDDKKSCEFFMNESDIDTK